MADIRVRFAPSPTGKVHIGNIRAAIYNWLFARHTGGKFLLRVEDTDLERSTPEAIQALFECMEWLGLDWDEEVFYQTKNVKRHLEVVDRLLATGHAYKVEKTSRDGKTGAVTMFRMPKEGVLEFDDVVKGRMAKKAEDVQDFAIVRSDGSPIFHIANVVDDIDQRVTHIILIQFSIRFPSAVSTEVFISFLGIGVQGEPSWGVMINNARARLWQGIWWEMTFTTLAIFVLVLVFNHLADYLRDRLDPALRSER